MPSPHKKLVVPGEHYFEKYQKARKEIQQLKSKLGEYTSSSVLMKDYQKVVNQVKHLDAINSKQKLQLEQTRSRLRQANEDLERMRNKRDA